MMPTCVAASPARRSPGAAILALLLLLAPSAHAAQLRGCSTDMDCQLNGQCVSGACECDVAWSGADCGTLDLDPTDHVAYGVGGAVPDTSSWGGGPPVYDVATSMWHLFVTEIAGHCGMCTWTRMSQAAHAVSKTPEGPYTRVSTAIPTQTHNVYYAYSAPDKMHLIYHIFGGDNPESCNPYYPCTNGSTPHCKGLGPPPGHWPKPSCTVRNGGAHAHYSKSLDGPWQSAGKLRINTAGMPSVAGSSNPAPYVFPNGTVLMMGRGKDARHLPNGTVIRGHNIFLYRAASWNATYEWVRGDGVNGSVNLGDGRLLTEDPVVWRGRRGFHVLLHSAPDLTHGWSKDGLKWSWSPQLIGPPVPAVGSDNERPRVALDAAGDIAAVFVSHEVGTGDASRTSSYVPRKR